ncbi:MAG TPA: HAD hydrolase family protein, partial [Candidatus Merdibacter merdigallinarum]|nr:HAD hydrolase family protein [Candidatus Merdibacter merdigallinarum]
YAIGDSYNDLPMIEEFHGFSVMSAPEKIKESSKQVYLSVADCIDDLLK